MVRVPTHRMPTHPGNMLAEEFLHPMNITQQELADSLHVPYEYINALINGHKGMTPSLALRLAKFFSISAEFWMNMQLRWDLYSIQQSERDVLDRIQPCHIDTVYEVETQ